MTTKVVPGYKSVTIIFFLIIELLKLKICLEAIYHKKAVAPFLCVTKVLLKDFQGSAHFAHTNRMTHEFTENTHIIFFLPPLSPAPGLQL